MQFAQIDFPVVASTFPDAPISLPTSDLLRSTEVIEATAAPARPAWLTTPVLIGGALLLAFLFFRR
jgi:hypothetical protein